MKKKWEFIVMEMLVLEQQIQKHTIKSNGKGYFSQIDLPGGDIQEQINKTNKLSPTVRLNASYIGDNDDVSNTEYGYLNGVTSSIQTQLNGKLIKPAGQLQRLKFS